MSNGPTWNDPDFFGHLLLERRIGSHLAATPESRSHPRRQLLRKLFNYRLAASHGIRIPQILGSWQDPFLIDWDLLPEEFVLKTNTGHSGASVWPLRRQGRSFSTVDQMREFDADELRGLVASKAIGRRLPIFAEEFLLSGSSDAPLPDDVKVYCAYGKVLHIMLRRMPQHADTTVAQYRYVDESGHDLGKVTPARQVSPLVPVPTNLEEVVRVAELLSLAVPLPFVRVDLYARHEDVLFGELTVNPGGMQRFRQEHSSWMAAEWEQAEARLQTDLANGRPYAVVMGAHSTHHLPEG
ncbi:ATP-grasp fold amidoligase family protein [Serinicoccus chungangensis]|nr:ATP-grasp fold amidoligase family protein [Serinicoccus chungangensis]